MARFVYTPAMIDFMREHYPLIECEDLAAFFNDKFGTDKTPAQIRSACRNHKISANGRRMVRGKRVTYSDEQTSFIRDGYRQWYLPELTERFNAQFPDDQRKQSQIDCFITNNGFTSGRDGRFEKGRESWNKGKTGYMGANRTSFKKGSMPPNRKPFGHERICSKDGFILIKVDETNPYTGHRGWYRHKHVVVWEQANGPVPDGHVISFIDGDKLNCSLDNLELMSRAAMCMLNARHAPKNVPPEMREAARTLAKVKARVGELRK